MRLSRLYGLKVAAFSATSRRTVSTTIRPTVIRPHFFNPLAVPRRTRQYSSQDTPPVGPQTLDGPEEESDKKHQKDESEPTFRSTVLKMMESAATMFASIAVLG